jgi:membrane protein required for colicin V production
MNELDVAILVVLAAFALYGAFKGLVRLGLGFASLALGILFAIWFSGSLSFMLEPWIRSVPGRRLAAAALIFFAMVIGCAILAWLIRKALKPVRLLWADRVAGATVGLLLASLLIASAMVPLAALLPADSSLLSESVVTPHVLRVSAALKNLVPADMKARFESARERLKEKEGQAGSGD